MLIKDAISQLEGRLTTLEWSRNRILDILISGEPEVVQLKAIRRTLLKEENKLFSKKCIDK